MQCDQRVDLCRHRERVLAAEGVDGRVDIEPRRGERTDVELVHGQPALVAALRVVIRIDPLHDGDHPVIHLAVAIAHGKVRREALRREVVGHRPVRSVETGRLGMGLQIAEALVALGAHPARERIDSAREGTIGMDAAAARTEEDTTAIVLARLQHGAARFGVASEELRGGDTEPARQPQRLVRPDPDRLVVAAPVAGVAHVRERAVAPEIEIDLGQGIAVRHAETPAWAGAKSRWALLTGRLPLALRLALTFGARLALGRTLAGALTARLPGAFAGALAGTLATGLALGLRLSLAFSLRLALALALALRLA